MLQISSGLTLICLHLSRETRYNVRVPVCPQCSANIHTGALHRCPACGYSLELADKVFGDGQVDFPRVLDVAGVLKHTERMDLISYLEDLERNLPPVALCVYITDQGRTRALRPHAHWILNHAHIHSPSFGRRELQKAFQDIQLSENIGAKDAPRRTAEDTGFLHGVGELWQALKARVRNFVRPLPAPAKKEWMLILVMDVQLEMACFSWGYRLDPYVNPERINRAITSARLQFRERATAQGIRKVMRNAVRIIASDSRSVMRRIRKEGKIGKPVGVETFPLDAARKAARLLLPAMLGLSLASAPVAMAAPASNTQRTSQRTAQKAAQRTAAAATRKPAAKPAAKATAKPAAKSAQRTARTTTAAKAATAKKTSTAGAARATARSSTKRSSSSSAKSTTQKAGKKDSAEKKNTLQTGPETVRDTTAPLIVPAKLPTAADAKPRLPDAPAPMAANLVDDDTAEEVEDDVPEVDVEDTPPPAPLAEAASFDAAPRWKPEDYALLMKGSLQTGYTALFPAKGAAAARPRTASKATDSEESDTKVLGRYCAEYAKPTPNGLIDPQGLLSTMEREDVEHLLRSVNGNGKFRVYAAVAKAGQEMPPDLAVGTLATAVAQPCEYSVLLLYYIGAPATLELGYQEIKADDAQRHAWLNKVRSAAADCGSGSEGLMAALKQTAANISPIAASFRPLTVENTVKAPKLDIPLKPDEEKEEPGFLRKLLEGLLEPENASLLPYLGGAFIAFAVFILFFLYRRHHAPELLLTDPDWRLSAKYGAGVSRLVKYMEGKESEKEKTLF